VVGSLDLNDKLNEAKRRYAKSLDAVKPTENAEAWVEKKCIWAHVCIATVEADSAIRACIDALEVCNKQQHPELWAKANHLAGTAYIMLSNDRILNVELGIGYLENALEIYTQDSFPEQWIEITKQLDGALTLLEELREEERMESVWGSFKAQTDEELCFVLMPFTDPAVAGVYEQIITEVAENNGLTPRRADDFKMSTPIMPDVWRGITSARVIIADLTNFNANVYYELGLCHALNKKPILMIQKGQQLPFDLHHFRTIFYSKELEDLKRARKELDAFIKKSLET
jgi:hypothetical protein